MLLLLQTTLHDDLVNSREALAAFALDEFHQLADGINVGAGIHRLFVSLLLLGGGISGCATGAVSVAVGKSKSQVDDFHIVVDACEHHVLWFQVGMHHVAAVHVLHGIQQLVEQAVQVLAFAEPFG